MKIIEENSGALTNSEVAAVLRDRGCGSEQSAALESEQQVFSYLTKDAPGIVPTEQLQAFLTQAQALGLGRAEALQCINLGPTSLVELHLIVSNIEERFGPGEDRVQERVQQLLQLIQTHVLAPAAKA